MGTKQPKMVKYPTPKYFKIDPSKPKASKSAKAKHEKIKMTSGSKKK